MTLDAADLRRMATKGATMKPQFPADFVKADKPLATCDQATLARWWADLNSWEWPADFPWAEPPNVGDAEIMTAFQLVDARVPRDLAIRAWNERHKASRKEGKYPR